MCKSTEDPLYGKGTKIEEDMFENEGHIRHFFSKAYTQHLLKNKFRIQTLGSDTESLYGQESSFIKVIAHKT